MSTANTWQGTGGYKFGRGRKLLRILCPSNLFVFSLDAGPHHLLKAAQRGPVTRESSAKPEYVFGTPGVDRPLCLKGQREALSLSAPASSFRTLQRHLRIKSTLPCRPTCLHCSSFSYTRAWGVWALSAGHPAPLSLILIPKGVLERLFFNFVSYLLIYFG